MTPTEQDKELLDSLNRLGFKQGNDGTWWADDWQCDVTAEVNELFAIITADRKRVALGARIEENRRWLTVLAPSMDENVAYNSDFHHRIAELKAQQEEV